MKKIISLVLVLAICMSLCACGKSDACSCDCAQCAQCEKKTHKPCQEDQANEPEKHGSDTHKTDKYGGMVH